MFTQTTFSGITEISKKRIIMLLFLFLSSYIHAEQCQLEIRSDAAEGQVYAAIFNYLESITKWWLPSVLSVPSRFLPDGGSTSVTAISDVEACFAVHFFFQWGVGYLLVFTVLFVEEACSRYGFAEDYPVESPIRPSFYYLMTWHLRMVPFEALVGFHAVIGVLYAKHSMRNIKQFSISLL